MAQFDANIDLNVKVDKALAAIDRVERRVARLASTAELDLKVKNADKANRQLKTAQKTTQKLAKALEGIESRALSKLPTALQTVVAYLKASVVSSKDLAFTLAGVGNKTEQLAKNTAGYTREVLSAAIALGKVANEQERLGRARQLSSGRGLGFLESSLANARNRRDQLVPGTSGYETASRQIIQLQSAINSNLRQQADIESRILDYQIQQKKTVESNVRASRASRQGSGFLAFSQESPQEARNRRALGRQDEIKRLMDNYVRALDTIRATANKNNIQVAEAQNKRIQAQYDSRVQKENEVFRLRNKLDKKWGQEWERRFEQRMQRRKRGARGGGGGGGAGGGLAAGIGFPLLFGGGPGSVIGGAIGSAGGFGTQVLSSAIGGIIDQAVAGVARLGQALNPLTADIDAVIAAAGESGTEFEKLVKDLEKVAGAEAALAAATAKLEIAIGQKGVAALREFGDESAELGRSIAEALSQISAAVATLINNSGILTALAQRIDRTSTVNRAIQDPNQSDRLRDLVQERERAARGQGERDRSLIDDEIVAEQKILDTAKETAALEELRNNTVAERTPELQAQINLLNAQIALEQSGLDLTTDAGIKLAEKVIRQETYVELQQAINQGLSTEAVLLKQTLRIQQLRNQAAADRDAKNRKAEAAAKRAAREAERAAKQQARIEQQLAGFAVKRAEIELKGRQFGQTRLNQIYLERQALLTIRDLKAEEINKGTEDIRIKQAKLSLLQLETELANDLLAQEEERLKVARQVQVLQEEQSLTNLNRSLADELTAAQRLPSGNPFEDDRVSLELEQQARAYEEITKRQQEVARLNKTISDTTLDDDVVTEARQRKQFVEEEIELYQKLLPQIAAAEQAQLKFNQTLELVQGPVNAFVSGMTSGLQAIIDGTKSAEEAFADMLRGIADALVQTATTMIAQYIAIGIARMFALGDTSKTPSLDKSGGGSPLGPLLGSMPFTGLATGGTATGGQPYIVGEKGPELFIPGVTGTVTNNDQFEAAREAMSGATGGGVSETGGLGSEGVSSAFAENTSSISTTNSYIRERSMETNNQTTIGGAGSMTIETQVINNVEYATVEQVRLASAASARQARAQVFSDLKNKPASRAQVGMR